jgi:hypothetical protein
MSYEITRIAFSDITAYALLNTSSYLLTNWTRQSDMSAAIQWKASMPEFGMRRNWQGGMELGSGAFNSPYSGVIDFFILTPLMQDYLNTQMSDKGAAVVTLLAYDDYTRTTEVFGGELVSPHVLNADGAYSPFGATTFSNNQYGFFGGTRKLQAVIGGETTDVIIGDESGGIIGAETQS